MKLSGEARIINESVEKKLDEARDLKIKNKFS